MSFFGGSSRSVPSGQPDQARLNEAAIELEVVSDMFNRLVKSCHAKCIATKYSEGELNKGESVCIDRCVSKYFAVQEKVQQKLAEFQRQQ